MTAPVAFATYLGLMIALTACGVSRVDDQPLGTIAVNGDVNHAAVHELKKARGREPTREELLELHRVWIENEILYREGLKLSADAGGASNREQLIFSALADIERRARPTSVPDDALGRWFESHRDRYEQPAKFDFEDATPSGQPSEATVRSLVDRLNADATVQPTELRVLKDRPESNLQISYGKDVAAALARAQPGRWLALPTRDGWRALRLVAMTAPVHAVLEAHREAVRRDWIEAQVAEKRDAVVKGLWQRYKIELAPPFECHAEN